MNDTGKELKKMRKAQRREIWRRLKKNKLAMVGLVIVAIFVLIAIFADVIADYDTLAIGMSREILKSPSSKHICGTDALGRDMFARLVHGSRVSLSIGIIVTIFAFAVGGIIGALAAYTGGMLDNIVMRICDTLMCIPAILMALAIVAALGTNMTNLVIAITISSV
ncbi:MAG: ABC transporter permease, partial [Firmicutes bacterium]|nr:ABC transporter permease [Bacillota bacterium]